MNMFQPNLFMKTVNFRYLPRIVLQNNHRVKNNWFIMKDSSLKVQVDRHARHLLDGEFDQLVGYYELVLPVFRGDDLILINGRIQLLKFFEIFRDHLLATGVTRIQGEIINTKTSTKGRFQNTVKWHYFDAEGIAAGSAQVLYYGTRRDGKSVIEVVHYQELDERRPDIWTEFQQDEPGLRIVHKNKSIH